MKKEIGVARISRPTQNIQRQIRNIKNQYPNANIIKIVYTGSKVTGYKDFINVVDKLEEGDTLIFDSASRMSRDSKEGCDLYEKLFNRNVKIVFLKEPHINTDVYKEALNNQIKLNKKITNFEESKTLLQDVKLELPNTPDISSFKKLMKNRDEKIQEQIIKPKDKAIKELQEQNALLTLTLNRQMKTIDKAVKYEKEIKPILEKNIELKEKCETLESSYNIKLQEEKTKIQDKYENRIYNLEKENNFLRKVINTFQKTVEKFIHWICVKFSISEEDELIRNFELENDTYINPIKQIEHEEELEYEEMEW